MCFGHWVQSPKLERGWRENNFLTLLSWNKSPSATWPDTPAGGSTCQVAAPLPKHIRNLPCDDGGTKAHREPSWQRLSASKQPCTEATVDAIPLSTRLCHFAVCSSLLLAYQSVLLIAGMGAPHRGQQLIIACMAEQGPSPTIHTGRSRSQPCSWPCRSAGRH